MKRKIFALQMVLCLCLTAVLPVLAEETVITIGNAEEFAAFAQNCTLDTWSEGKTVRLTDDIDFSDTPFAPVPTFGGTFEGNGYTIRGIQITEKGSYMGVFRYIRQNGKVSALHLQGEIVPGGAKTCVGGIVGENAGTVENCSFSGIVKGENTIGGIAGHNTESGKILSCNAEGNINGENATGGIAGKNSGLLQNCINQAAVNTVYEEKKSDITDLETDTGAVLENYKTKEEENEEESLLGHSDTGGIVGYTDGIVQGCVNRAAVGYRHVGYNVGGVAGRQAGYMLGCRNEGLIQGRKDVGGIVGQAEPYILLNTSESMLRDLRHELDSLHTMVNRFITDTDSLGDKTREDLRGISDSAKEAGDNAEVLLRQGTDFVDDNVSEINAQAAILSNTLDRLTPVFESLENGGTDLTAALDDLTVAFDDISIYAPDLNDEFDEIEVAMEDIKRGTECLRTAISRANKAKERLGDAVRYQNASAVREAVSELSAAVQELASAQQTVREATEKIENILQTRPKDFETIGINAKEIAENLKTIAENLGASAKALGTIKNSLDTILRNTNIDYSALRSAANQLQIAIGYFSSSLKYTTRGMESLIPAIRGISDKLTAYTEDVAEQLETAKDNVSGAVKLLSYASEDITAALDEMKNILADLAAEDDPTFVKLGDDFKQTSETLFDTLSDISSGIERLETTLSDGVDTITGNVSAISNQFQIVMRLLLDEAEELQSGSRGLEDIFVDASEEDIKHTKQGKVADCHNFGAVQADRNTGGIAGAVAIEYAKDPEDETDKPNTLNFTYRSKAILQSCINDGTVEGKKDCTGGIAGLAEIGTIYECENYAKAESTNGNYVGGIAGKSASAVRKCYAKSALKGKRYVGGIAGKAETVTACYAIAHTEGEENVGAICGDAEKRENLYADFYVESGTGAVDGISYRGKAEPIAFEQLREKSGVPERFISFTVTFLAEDMVVATQDIKYGESADRIKYPEIPPKEGHFGKWEQPMTGVVTEDLEVICTYQPYITILPSAEKNESGKLALALCEGEFTDEAEFHIAENEVYQRENGDNHSKVYDISLVGTNIAADEPVMLRLLKEQKEKVSVWEMQDGAWQKVQTTDKGKYVRLQTHGTDCTLRIRYEGKTGGMLWMVSLGIAAVVAVLVLLYKKRKKQNK